MKKFIASCLLGGALVLGSAVGASAGGTIGTPGTANCQGQTTTFIAQLGKNFDLPPQLVRGFGGVARVSGLTAEQIHDIIAQYCGQ